jgi:hypothetical protein
LKNTYYKVRYFSDGIQMRAKVWLNNTEEPIGWDANLSTFGTPTTGNYIGIRFGRDNGVGMLDNLLVNDLNYKNPAPPDTRLNTANFNPSNNSININPRTRLRFYVNSSNLTLSVVSKFTLYNGSIYSLYTNTTNPNQNVYYSLPLLKYNKTYTWNISVNNSKLYNVSKIYQFTTAEQPIVDLRYPLNTSYNISILNLRYNIINHTRMDKCWYSKNYGVTNSSKNNAFVNFTGVTASLGSNTWIVYCNDSNNYVTSDRVSFFVHNVPPNILIISPTNKTYNRATYDMKVSTDEPTQWCIFSYNNFVNSYNITKVNSTFYQNLSLTLNAQGPYTLKVRCIDSYNNTNTTRVSFKLDILTPVMTITYPLNTIYGTYPKLLNYTVSDLTKNYTQSCRGYNGTTYSAWQSYSVGSLSLGSKQGSNTWFVYCNNTFNEIGMKNVSFNVNTSAPLITVYSPVNTTYITYNTSYNLKINFTANVYAQLWYKNATGGNRINYIGVQTRTFPTGQYTFQFYANNSLGIISNTNVSFKIINLTRVRLTIRSPNASNIYVDKISNISISVNATINATSCNYSLTNSPLLTGSLSYNAGYWTAESGMMTSLGSKTLTVTCFKGSTYNTSSFIFNLQEYVIKPNISTPHNGIFYNATNLLNLTGQVLSSQTYYCQNYTADNGNNPLSIKTNTTPQTGITDVNCKLGAVNTGSPIDRNIYQIYVKNNGGYNSTNTSLVFFYYDDIKPTVTINQPAPGSYDNEISILDISYSDANSQYLQRVWYTIGGVTYTYCNSTGTCGNSGSLTPGPNPMPSGTQTIYAYATDTANNTKTQTVVVTINALYLTNGITNGSVYNRLSSLPPNLLDYTTNANDQCRYYLNGIFRDEKTFLIPNMPFFFNAANITGHITQGRNNVTVRCNNLYGTNVTLNHWFIYATQGPWLGTIVPKNATTYNTTNFTMTFNVTSPFNITSITYDFDYDIVPLGSCDPMNGLSGTYTGPFMYNPSNPPGENCDGKIYLHSFRADDEYGNLNYSDMGGIDPFLHFYINQFGPTIIVNDPDNITYYAAVPIDFTIADLGAGVDKMWFEDDTGTTYYTGPTTKSYPTGTHYLIAYANDTSGKMTNSAQINFTTSLGILAITKISPPDGTKINYVNYTNQPSTFNAVNWTVSNSGATDIDCWYNFNNGSDVYVANAETMMNQFLINPYNDNGINTYKIHCNDSFVQSTNTSGYFYMDLLRPNITIHSPVNNSRHNQTNIFVNLTVTDNNLDKIIVTAQDNQAFCSVCAPAICALYCSNMTPQVHVYTVPYTVTFPQEGKYEISVYANDTFKNSRTKINYLEIDSSKPSIILNSPSASNTSRVLNNTPILFNITFYDKALFGFNLTCRDSLGNIEFSNQTVNITTSTFNYTQYVLLTKAGQKLCNIIATDDHTDNLFNAKIEKKKPVFGFGDNKLIINGEVEFIYDKRNTLMLDNLSWEVSPDRVSPVIKLKSPKMNGDNKIYWTVKVNKGKINSREQLSGIKGHIVIIPNNDLKDAYWYDALTEYEPSQIKYEIVGNEVRFEMTISGNKLKDKTIKTRSIGGLNIAELNFSFFVDAAQNTTFTGRDFHTGIGIPMTLRIRNSTSNYSSYYVATNITLNLKCDTYFAISNNSAYYNNNTYTFNSCTNTSITDRFWQTELWVYVRNQISSALVTGLNITVNSSSYFTSRVNTANPTIFKLVAENYTINISSQVWRPSPQVADIPIRTRNRTYINVEPSFNVQFYREETDKLFNFTEKSQSYPCANGTMTVINYTEQENPDSYSCYGNWSSTNDCLNTVDGLYGTFGETNGTVTNVFMNYTKPIEATNASKWVVQKDLLRQVQYSFQNMSSCWNGRNPLQFRAQLNKSNLVTKMYCRNNTGWKLVDTYVNGAILYEERMNWGYPSVVTSYDTCTNATQIYMDLEVYCPNDVLIYRINNTRRIVSGITCDYDYWLLKVHYSTEEYYRTIIPDINSIDIKAYLLDLNYDEAVQLIITITDLNQQYDNGRVRVYKFINNTRQIVIEQYLDLEKKVVLWLDKFQNYEICTIDDDGIEECHGNIFVDQAGTKNMILPKIKYTPIDNSIDSKIKVTYKGNKVSGLAAVTYYDATPNGYDTLTWNITDIKGKTVAFQSFTNGRTTVMNVSGLDQTKTYYTEIISKQKDFKYPLQQKIELWRGVNNDFGGFTIKQGNGFKMLVAVFTPLLIMMVFSLINAEIGAILAGIIVFIFARYEWYGGPGNPLNGIITTVISLAVVGSLLYMFIQSRRKP